MRKLRIGICDDEISWLQKARDIIGRYADSIDYEVEMILFQSKADIVAYEETLDAVFMDIELKDGNGIQAVSFLQQKWKETMIVYLTNYLFYATDAYETDKNTPETVFKLSRVYLHDIVRLFTCRPVLSPAIRNQNQVRCTGRTFHSFSQCGPGS